MLPRTPARALPMVSRTVDLAPAAQACCGLCRTCMTANAFGVVAAAGAWLALRLGRAVGRA